MLYSSVAIQGVALACFIKPPTHNGSFIRATLKSLFVRIKFITGLLKSHTYLIYDRFKLKCTHMLLV